MAEKRYSLRVVLDKMTHEALKERARQYDSTMEEMAYYVIMVSLTGRLARMREEAE